MNTVQVALYARVSSEQQSEAKTIESQLADLRGQITARLYGGPLCQDPKTD